MDNDRFDHLARAFVLGSSRRGVVVGLTSILLASRALSSEGATAKKRKNKKKCAKSGQTPKKKKGCCRGLRKDATGRCAQRCDVCASGCAFTSVQAAINDAAPGATLTLCAGTFTETIVIAKNLTLIGAGDGAGAGNTILDGASSGGSAVRVEEDTIVTLQNLRLTGGNNSNAGGGIFNSGTLELTGCTVSTNTALLINGGGIRNSDLGTVTLKATSVTGNHAAIDGGGISNSGAIICSGGSTVSGNTRSDPPVPSNCANDGGRGCASCPD